MDRHCPHKARMAHLSHDCPHSARALGLAGAALLTRFLTGMLFGVTATDPTTYAAAAVAILVVAAMASYLPARRAMHADPVEVLRSE